MNIVFIHGRGQGHRSEAEIRTIWLEGLDNGYRKLDLQPIVRTAIATPFYGAELDRLTAARDAAIAEMVERGAAGGTERVDPLIADLVAAIADRAGVQEEEALAAAQVPMVERGPQHWRWVQALAQAAQRRAPWLANLGIGHFAADVIAYLTRAPVRRAVFDLVRPAVAAGPCVVVSHSLGTIVAYQLLAEMGSKAQVPLFVTTGSPLGIGVIKQKLKTPLEIPAGVRAWLNATDPRDYVALTERLDGDTFVAGIDNIADIANPFDPHDIRGYLADTRVTERIVAALD